MIPGAKEARENLARVEHIVVLQLENRSFDHMLGYLGLENPPLEAHDGEHGVWGLQHAKSSFHDGHEYPPEEFDETSFERHGLNPPHEATEVATQIADGAMTGFVDAWADKLYRKSGHLRWFKRAFKRMRGRPFPDPEDLAAVMGHMTAPMVPVFDHLARRFCVCDNWFCSVAGPTMPNRFFSVAGTHRGIMSNVKLLLHEQGSFTSLFQCLPHEHMWRWYSSDPAMLRAVDRRYRFDVEKIESGDPPRVRDHFAYFDHGSTLQPRTFLGDVLKTRELPEVAWIDPNFAIAAMFPGGALFDGVGSNDDHPPIRAIEAQRLVNKVYEAIGRSPYWDNTLLIVYYDEHGGFYDHVQPPGGRGPRIPALLVGGPVKPGVSHEPFDHASIIKTILLRFGHERLFDKLAPDARERMTAATALDVALRGDGGTTPFVPVTHPGGAAVTADDLEPGALDEHASKPTRALDLLDRALTDLQELVVKHHAIPLRTGRTRPSRLPTKRLTKLAVRVLPDKPYDPADPERLPDRHP